MQVTVKLYGDLRKYATHEKPSRWIGELNDRSTVDNVISSIGCPPREVVRVIRDGLPIEPDTSVADGDLLHFLTLLGGG